MGQAGMHRMVGSLYVLCWVLVAFPQVLACLHQTREKPRARLTCTGFSLLV